MIKKILLLFGILTFLGLVSLVSAQDNVMFNYQGRVKVQGQVFTGTGQFKLAIINNVGDESLWSNDNTSLNGGEPTSAVSIAVSEGIFNVMVGDTILGMASINRSIFNHPDKIKLRIWFSDGTHGFQQLVPDHKLLNIELLGMTSGADDFTIYVNGATGNDKHNGLSPGNAKKTIQAAVDILPERLKCNVTIDIADGIYREEVYIFGISMQPGKTLTLIGDEGWVYPTGNPAVRVTGTDDDVTPVKIRNYGFNIRDCEGIIIQGILFDYCVAYGLLVRNGSYTIDKSKATNNGQGIGVIDAAASFTNCESYQNPSYGFYTTTHANSSLNNCISTYNGKDGFCFFVSSTGVLRDCIGNNNTNNGLYTNSSQLGLYGTCEFSNNSESGIKIISFSKVWFDDIVPDFYSGQINNNGYYPIHVGWMSYSDNHTLNTFSGNSPSDSLYLHDGGYAY